MESCGEFKINEGEREREGVFSLEKIGNGQGVRPSPRHGSATPATVHGGRKSPQVNDVGDRCHLHWRCDGRRWN
ncbi:hypothetical protein V6Z11_A07G219700 [Gossypium hirsutum]